MEAIVVHEEVLFGELLVHFLKIERGIDALSVAEPRKALSLLDQIFPGLFLLSLSFAQDEMKPLINSIRERANETFIVGILNGTLEEDLYKATQLGIQAYLSRNQTITELSFCLERAKGKKPYIPFSLQSTLVSLLKKSKEKDIFLNRREKEILLVLCRGCSNKKIAKELNLSEKTVANSLSNIYGKLGVTSRTQAILAAQRLSLSSTQKLL